MMEIGKFKVTGLCKAKSFTCEPIGDEANFFWPETDISQERFDKLWDYMETVEWSDVNIIADIEYESLTHDGIPMNCKVIDFEIL